MEMVEEKDRADALSAIALVERLAQVTTIGVFGALVSIPLDLFSSGETWSRKRRAYSTSTPFSTRSVR